MAKPPADLADFARQEVRIAAVLNGGVSLAVWMSGVTLELHHLAMASNGLGTWPTYARILDALGAKVRIDVIAGTSAGGLNGAFLALGQARKRDFESLRDVWAEAGSLEKLLRKPLAKDPPSVLAGDDYFLVQIEKSLRAMVSDWADLDTGNKIEMPPVELILTGTLWEGRESQFSDDMGTPITERDYDATFRFVRQVGDDGKPVPTAPVGDLMDPTNAVLTQLAGAARCTSSFPAAFEPHYVEVTPSRDDREAEIEPGRWSSTAGRSNFDTSQYVLDGGILLNKPLRPALQAIYNQTAKHQVRRVLGYVVPDPGEPPADRTTQAAAARAGTSRPDVPTAPDVLLSVLTRLTSTDSVSRELAEIRDTNASVRTHRRTRDRLGRVLNESTGALVDKLWAGYCEERIDSAATTIAQLIATGQRATSAGADRAALPWSEQELAASLRQLGKDGAFGFVPNDSEVSAAIARTADAWTWGQTTLVRLSDMTTDLLLKAMLLAPVGSDEQARIVAVRDGVRTAIIDIARYERDLAAFWIGKSATGTTARSDVGGQPGPRAWLAEIVNEWDTTYESGGADGRRSEQYKGALALAGALVKARPTIVDVLRPYDDVPDPGDDVETLQALLGWLLPEAADAETVLHQMLELDVVLVATSGALAAPEQTVELVQISCENRDNVTGMQLHHFGAFYRKSWRLNDWIEGRMDGTRQVVRMLLDPDRFRQRGWQLDDLVIELRAIATDARRECGWLVAADRAWLADRWDANSRAYRDEVDAALDLDSPVSAFDKVCDAVAMPIRLLALRADLPKLADAVLAEGADAQRGSAEWLRQYQSFTPVGDLGVSKVPSSTAEGLWGLREAMSSIGTQQITDDFGSDTFARTVSHAAVVTTGAFSAKTKLGVVKPVRAVLAALRGYTAMVYAMVAYLSRGSRIGPIAVGTASAAGGVLLAVAMFVPNVPVGLTLAGVLLLFAAASASALLTPSIRAMGVRVLIVALVVLGALGWLVYREIHRVGFHGEVASTLIKIGIGLGVVLVGWFVASGAWPRLRRRARQSSGSAPKQG